MGKELYTVGHSTHSFQKLVGLLQRHNVNAVADVRSSPYSRMNPQFNRETLSEAFRRHGITYVFLGEELGARPSDSSCYAGGRVQYELLAATELFQKGLHRVAKGAERYCLTLLCAEKDPTFCHRMILISRLLVERGRSVTHILESGLLESQEQAEERLLKRFSISPYDMFRSRAQIVAEAFRKQEELIAYQEDDDSVGTRNPR